MRVSLPEFCCAVNRRSLAEETHNIVVNQFPTSAMRTAVSSVMARPGPSRIRAFGKGITMKRDWDLPRKQLINVEEERNVPGDRQLPHQSAISSRHLGHKCRVNMRFRF